MKTIRFGLIGCGLMGREFASATARWCHLLDADARPELVAVCNRGAAAFEWFRRHFPGIAQYTHDYRDLLANVESGCVFTRDADVVWRCRNCGYLHQGKGVPELCPACAHPRDHFELLGENW